MFSKSIFLAVSILALEASAFWRLPCRQRLSLERIDPIDTPGTAAHHVHTIHGGNSFSKSCTNDGLRQSTCTSCSVKEDLSAYWTPNLYWEGPDGYLTALNQTGGMLVYYLQRGENVKPFPKDFRIIAGDSNLRNVTEYEDLEKSQWATYGLSTDQNFLRQKAVGFNCLNYAAPAEAALGLSSIPQNRRCPDGLRAEIFFPSCWNGKDADSPDHRSHMAYPSTMDNGECPEGYPIRLPSLFFETIWNIDVVAGKGGRLVFSHGDIYGRGSHGDFMNGWDQDVLEKAINTCTDPSGEVEKCGVFTFNTEEEYSQCTKKPEIDEDVWGPMKKLPGCNDITEGTDYVVKKGTCGDSGNDKEYSSSKASTKSKTYPTKPKTYSTKSKASTVANPAPTPYGGYKKGKGNAPNEEADPNVVVITITETEYKRMKVAKTVTEGVAYTTVTAPTVYETNYVKRHVSGHKRRLHKHI